MELWVCVYKLSLLFLSLSSARIPNTHNRRREYIDRVVFLSLFVTRTSSAKSRETYTLIFPTRSFLKKRDWERKGEKEELRPDSTSFSSAFKPERWWWWCGTPRLPPFPPPRTPLRRLLFLSRRAARVEQRSMVVVVRRTRALSASVEIISSEGRKRRLWEEAAAALRRRRRRRRRRRALSRRTNDEQSCL